MADLIQYVCRRAARRFGGNDGTFNAACFSGAWKEVTGLRSGLDGLAVEAMLHGRADVIREGAAHYRVLPAPRSPGTAAGHRNPGEEGGQP
jgi:hypothetical protein